MRKKAGWRGESTSARKKSEAQNLDPLGSSPYNALQKDRVKILETGFGGTHRGLYNLKMDPSGQVSQPTLGIWDLDCRTEVSPLLTHKVIWKPTPQQHFIQMTLFCYLTTHVEHCGSLSRSPGTGFILPWVFIEGDKSPRLHPVCIVADEEAGTVPSL